MKRWGLFLAMLLSVTFILLPGISVAEEVAGRNVGHSQKTEMMEVGDVPGHFMGVSQFHVLAFYTKGPDKGEIITRMGTSTFDVVKGKGTATGYEVKPFRDGSMVVLKNSGTSTPIDGGKKTAFEGTWEVVGGTGRYAGAKGTGTYKGERIGDFKTGGDYYADFTGTITMK
ncbi:MAG TPA: hypothetical protein PK416_10880 [Thermodesulfobacteriota bacterium]|nr:hypothetical protein [Thermodesulfobacteriota bacterium]